MLLNEYNTIYSKGYNIFIHLDLYLYKIYNIMSKVIFYLDFTLFIQYFHLLILHYVAL